MLDTERLKSRHWTRRAKITRTQTILSSAATVTLSAKQSLWRVPIGIHNFSFGNSKYQEIIREPTYKSI